MDAAAPGDLAAIYAVLAGAHAEANAAEPYRPRADLIAFLRHPPEFEQRFYRVGDDGADTCGFAELSVPRDGSAAKVQIVVRGDARRRGHGSALLAAVREQADLLGCRTLIASHSGLPGAAFAARAGAADTRRDVRSLLTLADAVLTSRTVEGYAVRSWIGPAPDDLVASYAQARGAISDAPSAADDEWSAWDLARVRDQEAVLERRGRDELVTVAVDDRLTVVGFTALRASRIAACVANTEDTAVLREHRRRSLARWIKVESLRRLQRDRPDIRLVTTTNAETNEAMRRLNRALGFRRVAVYTTCVLTL